jgi:hypothetical protein
LSPLIVLSFVPPLSLLSNCRPPLTAW